MSIERQAMMDYLAALRDGATCGESCWHAREDVCRCSCRGANHGSLRAANGAAQPARTAVIQSVRYQLAGVGNYDSFWLTACELCHELAPGNAYYNGHERGAPARRRAASRSEVARWPELAAYRGQPAYEPGPDLLWVRVEYAEYVARL